MAATSDAEIVLGEVKERVKWVRLNRPEVRNALMTESADRMREEISRAGEEGARVVVIIGSGGSFSAGADLRSSAGGDPSESVRELLVRHYHPLLTTIAELPQPVIAAVDGPAAGIGNDIALACDLRLMSERAYFTQLFVNIGLVPDGGGTYTVQRLAGTARAMEMALTGRRVDAETSLAWGLVNAVYSVEEFEEKVAEFAEMLAGKAPLSMERSKRAIRAASANTTLEEAMLREAEYQKELFETEDFAEGVAAFFEKRAANFQGK